jgi:hypothetical protein
LLVIIKDRGFCLFGRQGHIITCKSCRRACGRKIPCTSRNIRNACFGTGFGFGPTVIIHVPFERDVAESREEGNFVAMELKRRATSKTANGAFANLVR